MDVKDFNVFEFSVSRKTDIFVHFDKLTYISVYIYTYVAIHFNGYIDTSSSL